MRPRTIRFWLICLVVICIVPGTLGDAFLFDASYRQQRAIVEGNAIATARALAQAVDQQLLGAEAGLQALATSPQLASGDLGSFYRQASEALPRMGGTRVVLIDAGGQQILDTLRPFGEALARHALHRASRRVFATAQPVLSGILNSATTGGPESAVEVPVLAQGKVVYLLAMSISPERLNELLRRQTLPPDGVAAIFNGTGAIVARTHGAEKFPGSKGLAEFIRLMGNEAEGAVDGESLEGAAILTAFSRSPRSGWTASIGIPKATLTANLWSSVSLDTIVTIILLGISLWIARRISVRIERSIHALHAPTHALGSGELPAIPTTQIVEVNEMGQALMNASRLIAERAIDSERAELQIREMIVGKQAAEQASRAKSEFLASMSHELRTPLNAISGFAQLLNQSGINLSPERRAAFTESIIQGAEQLGRIIDDMLDMARIEAGHFTVTCEVLDCLEVMTEAFRTLDALAKARGILFTADTSGNLPHIIADRGRLIQILLNLGSNAIKYNSDGGWAQLSAVPHDATVRFIIRDTGPGIPAERHGEVFEPFNRLGAEFTRVEGTGIGLAISRRLAQAMNGTIGFESAIGQGSKFWVELPVAKETAARSVEATSLAAAATDPRSKILCIEDKTPNVELMRAVIEDLSNTKLIDVQTVEEGLKIARILRPDLVITDIHLPDGKGFDVLRGLRSDPGTSHIPVIALTADAMPSNVHNMALAGFDHILTKPLKIPDLMKILHATLKAA
jgi:signal transduction histidine kinase/CheY-like chemotaxis protein